LGNWKNYEELEENLSIDELIHTLNAYRKRQSEDQKFFAALQGVDLSDKEPENITEMTPSQVVSSGFGVGMGLGHSIQSIDQGVESS
jgi:hypothetical protein